MNAAAPIGREEQLIVQLAGVSVAALGGTKEPCLKGQWGWSVAYQDTLDLRLKYDAAMDRIAYLEKACEEYRATAVAAMVGDLLAKRNFKLPPPGEIVHLASNQCAACKASPKAWGAWEVELVTCQDCLALYASDRPVRNDPDEDDDDGDDIHTPIVAYK